MKNFLFWCAWWGFRVAIIAYIWGLFARADKVNQQYEQIPKVAAYMTAEGSTEPWKAEKQGAIVYE